MKYLCFNVLLIVIVKKTTADYLVSNNYPSTDCQGESHVYYAENIRPCTQPDGPRVSKPVGDGIYESIFCINSTSWVRNRYYDASCTTPTSTINENGYQCSKSSYYGRSSSLICRTDVPTRPTYGVVGSNIYRRDYCSQPPITFFRYSRDVCIFNSYYYQGIKYVCDVDAIRQFTYSDPDCLGNVIQTDVWNYGCNLTIPYMAPRLLDCFDNPPAPANADSSAANNFVITVVGGVAGGAFVVVILVVAAVLYCRRRSSTQSSELEPILIPKNV